jgi:hypothetical protein
METSERIAIFQEALDHQFDSDDSAKLDIKSNDPLLKAAQNVVNKFSAYNEISISPDTEFFEFLEIVAKCFSTDVGETTRR